MSVPAPGSAPRWWSTAVTAVGVVAAMATGVVTVYLGFVESGSRRPEAAVVGLVALAGLAWRHRHPVGVLVVELILAGMVDVMAGGTRLSATARFVVVVALYAMGSRSDARRGLVAAISSGMVLTVTELAGHRSGGAVVGDLILIIAVTAIFFYVRSYRALIDSYRERAEQAEREQWWQTNRAVGAERVRIARELHDVVAHHVSLLVVQAGAVRETLPADHPTRPVLDSMIDGGRHAMAELRDMLDALRVDGLAVEQADAGPVPRGPQPDMDQIPELVTGARSAGMEVDLQVDGSPRPLSRSSSLAAYRIVQESLTNVVKHAAGSPTQVRVVYGPTDFELTVTNTAVSITGLPRWPGSPDPDPVPGRGPGHGLTGMRERVALAHGQLAAGPCAGGWQVCARFPAPASGGARPTVGERT